jgi:hypothetical protein
MIYIDMEMPNSCESCIIADKEFCTCSLLNKQITELSISVSGTGRPYWCPLHYEDNMLTEEEYHRSVAGLSDI